MKCYRCNSKDLEETVSLTEYGRNRLGKDPTSKYTSDYCMKCFDEDFPELHTRTDNEKSNN